MTKLKKLIMLCTAMVATASLALVAGCTLPGGNTDSSSSEPSNNSSSSTPVEPVHPTEKGYYYEFVETKTEKVVICTKTEVTVNFAEAGLYYICSDNEAFSVNSMPSYTINVAEAGDVTLNLSVNDWEMDENFAFVIADGTEVDATFDIYKIYEVEVDETLKAGGFMCTGAYTPITVTLPEASIYTFKTVTEANISTSYNPDEGIVGYSVKDYTIVTNEANTEVTLYIQCESNFDDFAFEVSFEKVTDEVPVYDETYTSSYFTDYFYFAATEDSGAGAYKVTTSASLGVFNTETLKVEYSYEDSYIFDYDGTNPVLLFINYGGKDGVEDLVITRIGDVGTRDDGTGEGEGGEEEDTTPTINALPQKDNILTLPARSKGKVCIVRIQGNFTISWNVTNPTLQVYAGVLQIESGSKFEGPGNLGTPLEFTVWNRAEEEVTVNFTIAEITVPAPELTVGKNALTIPYYPGFIAVTFTATEAGNYTFTVADELAAAFYPDEQAPEFPAYDPISGAVAMEAGETVSLYIRLLQRMNLAVVVTVAKA